MTEQQLKDLVAEIWRLRDEAVEERDRLNSRYSDKVWTEGSHDSEEMFDIGTSCKCNGRYEAFDHILYLIELFQSYKY